MKNRQRPGYALIELLVVLTVTAIMLTLSAGLIHLLLKLDRSSRSAREQAADLSRLAHDFRLDLHASVDDRVLMVPLPDEAGSDRIKVKSREDTTIEYEVRPSDYLRTVRVGDKVRHYEVYRRPPRSSARFQSEGDGPGSFVVLRIDQPTDGRDDSLYRDYRIEAEIGRDHRLNPRTQ